MKDRQIVLRSENTGRTLEAKFDEHGALFLASSSSGLNILREIRNGELVYAVFTRSGRKIFAASVNRSASVGKGLARCRVLPGLCISIGPRSYTFAGPPGNLRRHAKVAVAIVTAAVFFLSVASYIKARHAGAKKAVSLRPAVSVPQNKSSVDGLISEAREYLRAGDESGARLSLHAAMDEEPDDPRVKKLIGEIEGENRFVRPDADAAAEEMTAEAKKYFDDGLRLSESKNYAAAEKYFKEAHEILRGMAVRPPFAVALSNAKKENFDELQREARPKIEEILKSVSESKALLPAAAAKKLKGARGELSEILDSMPDDPQALKTKAAFDEAARALGERWIAAAETAWRLSGCTEAISVFDAISEGMEGLDDSIAAKAALSVSECKKRRQLQDR